MRRPTHLLFLCLLSAGTSRADMPAVASRPDGLHFSSENLSVDFAADHPGLGFLAVDSIGKGRIDHNVLGTDSAQVIAYSVTRSATASTRSASYFRRDAPGTTPAWTLEAGSRQIRATSLWGAGPPPAPLTLTFDTHQCYATLLGLFDDNGDIELPALLHLPGFGTLRLSADTRSAVGYASGPGWIRITFPAADAHHPRVSYRWSVTAVYPEIAGIAGDARYDGFRRNWLNIFQLNPNRRLLSNNTNSDSCGFCYYEYADIARQTPALAGNLYALDMVRQSLERVLGGTKTYGMPGYGDFPQESADTFPSLLIAADDYVEGRGDAAWLAAHYVALRALGEKMLATDHDQNGLIEYVATGNAGSWNEGQPRVRPSNWWDTIGFGHEDAYANALAYRALQGLGRMAATSGHPNDARRFALASRRLHDAYFPAFYNRSTGLLAGWRSADGALHDYAFLFVNSIAVLYGLVPPEESRPIMDRLWDDIAKAGYRDFAMGLPGNLVPVARRDYAHKNPRYGGGLREDNADGFQIYENGGATACFAYFTIAAFNSVGERARADQILLPLLGAFERREFEGTGSNGLTNDWRKWDGTAEGYEGFLTDNYYALLAVPQGRGGLR